MFTFTQKNPSEFLVEQWVKSNKKRVKSSEQRAKINEQRAESNKQRAKTNKQRAKTNEQQAKSNEQWLILCKKVLICILKFNFLSRYISRYFCCEALSTGIPLKI